MESCYTSYALHCKVGGGEGATLPFSIDHLPISSNFITFGTAFLVSCCTHGKKKKMPENIKQMHRERETLWNSGGWNGIDYGDLISINGVWGCFEKVRDAAKANTDTENRKNFTNRTRFRSDGNQFKYLLSLFRWRIGEKIGAGW